MADVLQCDGCGTIGTYTINEQTDTDEMMWWVRLGWQQGEPLDACTTKCAKTILDEMEAAKQETEEETANTPT